LRSGEGYNPITPVFHPGQRVAEANPNGYGSSGL
jgi:hypothetical protein